MENQVKKGLSKTELIIVIVAGLILALGLAAMIAGGYWTATHKYAPTSYILLTFGILWFVTSPLLLIGIVCQYSRKTMMILSIVALCTINAAGLATLLLMAKKKKATPVATTSVETTPVTEVKPETVATTTTSTQEVKPEEPKEGQ